MFRQKEKPMRKEQEQKKKEQEQKKKEQEQKKKEQEQKKKEQQQKEEEKMSAPFLLPQEDKEGEVEMEMEMEKENDDDNNDVSNINVDNDDHGEHNDDVDDEDKEENEKSRILMLETWKSLLLEKRQVNEKLTTSYNELIARRDHLIDHKLQLLVSIITTLTPDSDDQEHSYLHWLNIENKNCINFIRQQIESDKIKANAYLDQYDEYQKNLRETIVQKELFDKYTMMSYKEVADAKEALTTLTKKLQEEIENNKLMGQEITKAAEEAYKNCYDEISTLESYENELMNVKKQLKFEAEKPNFLKKVN